MNRMMWGAGGIVVAGVAVLIGLTVERTLRATKCQTSV